MATLSNSSDTYYMGMALNLADTGLGRVAPNPSVGCVIVKDGKIIASARTQDGGRPHAEVTALAVAGSDAQGADIYVTLEPCFHPDRSSCASALIAVGVRRLVIGCLDENPAIHGKGVAALIAAGIEVVTGCLEEECRSLNKGFFLSRTRRRPLVSLKTAISLDGKIATRTGGSRWITGPESRARVHLERSRHDAILTGINTILADDPFMTTRVDNLVHKSRRIILDTHLKLPETSRILKTKNDGEVIVFASENAGHKKQVSLEDMGVRIIPAPLSCDGKISLEYVLNTLAQEGVTRLMVEGGQTILTTFLRSGLWDDLYIFRAPILIGTDGRDAFGSMDLDHINDARRLKCLSREGYGEDVLEHFRNET